MIKLMLTVSLLATLLLSFQSADPKPPPSLSALGRARVAVREVYKEDYSKRGASDRLALGRNLIKDGIETTDDPVLRAAMLLEARDVSAAVGDVETLLKAIKELERIFGITDLQGKYDVLEKADRKARSPEASVSAAVAFLAIAETALSNDDYGLADKASLKAERAARRARDAELFDRVKDLRDRLRALKREYARVAKAFKTLEETPDDPAANLAAGKFVCFVKADWEKGLSMLALGGDDLLAKLAADDNPEVTEPVARATIGDRWWAWGEKQRGGVKDAARSRAVHYYVEVLSGLSLLRKVKLEKRIEAFYASSAAHLAGAVQRGNVALSKNGTKVSRAAPELLDGIVTGHTSSSGFASIGWPGEWVITLPKTYVLRQIRVLIWDGGASPSSRFYRFVLETSPDGKTYVPLVDRSRGEWRSWQTIEFPARLVQTIRLKGIYNSANNGFHVVEVEAYCIPPANAVKPNGPSKPAPGSPR